jgi:hypothetical protein
MMSEQDLERAGQSFHFTALFAIFPSSKNLSDRIKVF